MTGRARYVDDLAFPGMLYGVTVRSNVARGRILGIRYRDGIPWDQVHDRHRRRYSRRRTKFALIEHDQTLPGRRS